MRDACRPKGRFSCLLKVIAAALWMTAAMQAESSGPTMTTVTDSLYRADGTAAAGTVLLTWPAFTTADGKAVAAGSLSVKLGNGGVFSTSLAPNTGAQPAGMYYKVVFQLTDDSVQAAWTGEYGIVSDNLPASDVLPGDLVQVAAASRRAIFAAIVREVDVEVTAPAYDRSQYTIRFANDAAGLLASKFAKATLPEPLPVPLLTTGPSSALYLPSLTSAQVTNVIATQITVDTGTAPPAGGGFEVRQSDGGWGTSSDGNLVGRYTTESIVLPRLSRVQEYVLRQYDSSSPPKYSRQSALVHVDYPL